MSDPTDVAALCVSYDTGSLVEADLAATPIEQFRSWLSDVVAAGLPEPNAMSLATADADGVPSVRHVLLKDVDPRGFVFFTNLGSRKGRELIANPRAALTFPWFAIHRQVIVMGRVEQVSREEARTYFHSRPRGSQLGAWASRQSEPLADRVVLEAEYERLDREFTGQVPLPDFWGGFLIRPVSVEFWAGRRSRLHDRLRYVATPQGSTPPLDDASAWQVVRLQP